MLLPADEGVRKLMGCMSEFLLVLNDLDMAASAEVAAFLKCICWRNLDVTYEAGIWAHAFGRPVPVGALITHRGVTRGLTGDLRAVEVP
jgi:hypothetical protein